MPNTIIKLKNSGTPSAVPSSLEFGEIGINYADGKLYYKAANSQILPYIGPQTESYGTINVNGTLLVASIPGDIFKIVPGTNIELSGSVLTDTLTISANITPAYTIANSAFDKANTANVIAQYAYFGANGALAVAQNGFGQANTARNHANSAFLAANSAFLNANNSVNKTGDIMSGPLYVRGGGLATPAIEAGDSNTINWAVRIIPRSQAGAFNSGVITDDATIIYKANNISEVKGLTIGPWRAGLFYYRQNADAATHTFQGTGTSFTGYVLVNSLNLEPTIISSFNKANNALANSTGTFDGSLTTTGSITTSGLISGNSKFSGQTIIHVPGILGANVGNVFRNLIVSSLTANQDNLEFRLERSSNGTSWSTAHHEIIRRVDATDMGYIRFGNINDNVLTFGRGDVDFVKLHNGGALTINSAIIVAQLNVVPAVVSSLSTANSAFNKANSYETSLTTGYIVSKGSKQYVGMSLVSDNVFRNGISFIDARNTDNTNNFIDSSIFFRHNADNSSQITFHTQPAGAASDRRAWQVTIANFGLEATGLYTMGMNVGSTLLASYNHANSGFIQANTALGVAQGAYLQANTARNQANTATTIGSSAFGQANAALTQASTARNHANSAYNQANVATIQATNAYARANDAIFQATVAYAKANAAINNINTVYLTSGSGTWTKPPGLVYLTVELCGGGGGSGGCDGQGAGTAAASTGGGGGGYVFKKYLASQLNSTESYSVGSGGGPGIPGVNINGNNGGNTTFKNLFAEGGFGGVGHTGISGTVAINASPGGQAANGDINISGGKSGTTRIVGGQFYTGSKGGDSKLGIPGTAPGQNASAAYDAEAGSGFGAGASGGTVVNTGTNISGNTGAPGIIILTEYIAN